MSRPFILAATYREAERIAEKKQFKRHGWRYIMTGWELIGTRHPRVLFTWDWSEGKSITDWHFIRERLTLTGAQMERVEKP